MRKSRAPDINDELVRVVLEIIDDWKGKLTWDLLLEAVEKASGHLYSRFTFSEYPEIANAFSFKKDALRGTWNVERSEPRDERVRAALEQSERFKSKVKRLEAENTLLTEQFVTWAINAERKGVTLDMLNAPLTKPLRDRSKGVD